MLSTPAAPRGITPLQPLAPRPVPAQPDPEPPRSCGWFDSSHELQRGVRVIEHPGFEQISFEVPLAWQLAGC